MPKAELRRVSASHRCETGLTGTAALIRIGLSPAPLCSGCLVQRLLPPPLPVSPEPLPSNCD